MGYITEGSGLEHLWSVSYTPLKRCLPDMPVFPFDICKTQICVECFDLTPTEVRCIFLQKRTLIFKYEKCRYEVVDLLQNTIKDKNDLIVALHDKIIMLEKEKDQTQAKKNYYTLR